jgi:hypothetical protein
MMRPIKSVLFAALMLLALTACSTTAVDSISATSAPTSGETPKAYILATPYAQQPAAGICATPEGEIVTVTINPDVPDPRCSKVKPDQKLAVINKTQNTIEVSLSRFTFSLQPGAEATIDTPFGEYLAPGVHQLQVSPCCGPELWLEASQ